MSQRSQYAECETRLRGYFRARVRNLADADELAQETWLVVLKQQDSYDPARGSFIAFALSRAHYCLLDYFQRTKDRWAMESLFCELPLDFEEGSAEALGVNSAGTCAPREESAWQRRLDYLMIVDKLLALPCPPHQIIVFVMVWLLESTPREIEAGSSSESLRRLEAGLETKCGASWCLPEKELKHKFRVLRQKLEQTLGQVINEPRTRQTYRSFLDRNVGDTVLRDYYTGAPRENIVQWWYSVMRVLTKTIHQACEPALPGANTVRRGK